MENNDSRRIARTESLFRDVNERIAESTHRFGSDDATFVCECSDPTCTERVHATLDDYHDVRDDGATFLLVKGHEDEQVEKVVERSTGYNVVRKVKPEVRRLVEQMNPRAA
jgi:hypothetical protein